ncbi:MAG TPA: serine/threonine-protein kinase [Burkholderiaceae bacterium]|nr:serine/threonine-protein kinase [Burkholderiaceae bacterium]
MNEKSGNESVSLTGPVVGHAGTAGHLPAGYLLREFRIERVVGEGGFSVVYLATDTRLERQVAIKEYMPTALATRNPDLSVHVRSSAQHREAFDAGLRSFINEAKLLARFEHRALVKVHQFWQEKGTAYMVMPFYSGPTLKAWSRQHPEPIDPAWLEQFLRLVMDALETLHKENCLHRDVAPDNILVLNERSPLLLDFGAARRVIGDMTQALTVILKPGFAPIEQYAESQSMRQGPWTDVYALCAVAYFLITGRAPTPSVTRVLADDLVPLRTSAERQFPPTFLAALDAGLTVRPQQRPQTIASLRALMDGQAVPDDTLTAPPGVLGTAPPAASNEEAPGLPAMAEPEPDDDKTRVVSTRNLPMRTGSKAGSTPGEPAIAPVEMAPTPDLTGDPTFEARYPSRSMAEHESAIAPRLRSEDGRESRLPLIIGILAIAAVIGAAWVIIGWLNTDIARSRGLEPAYPTPAPAPKSGAVVTPPAVAAASNAELAAASRNAPAAAALPGVPRPPLRHATNGADTAYSPEAGAGRAVARPAAATVDERVPAVVEFVFERFKER